MLFSATYMQYVYVMYVSVCSATRLLVYVLVVNNRDIRRSD